MNKGESATSQPTGDVDVLFREEQCFRQVWLWVVVLGTVAATALPLGWGAYRQLLLGQPWGQRPIGRYR